MRKLALSILTAIVPVVLFACSDTPQDSSPEVSGDDITADDYVKPEEGKDDSSVLATILDFEYDGELITDYSWDPKSVVNDQMLYTIGQLNGEKAVGRLDRLELTNLQKVQTPEGKTKITYHAKMPVAWGSKTNLPKTFEFILPKDVSSGGTEAFTTKYKGSCAESGAHEIDSGSMWYYYRPDEYGCKLDEADVVKMTAKVTVSAINSTGKYPEYHKVWEDNALNVVAVFGKYEDGATSTYDAGIQAFNEFSRAMSSALASFSPTSTPATIPTQPGPGVKDIEWKAKLADGKTVQVNAILVDNVATAANTTEFVNRYEPLSTKADFIVYNGHAGLGQNVRALAKKGKWVSGQYLILFMNGCDTYAYVDGYLAQTRAPLNPDDPTGTKYMDIVTNAMPAFFASDSEATMAVFNGLMSYQEPKTYEQIMKNIDMHQIVLVTGDNDNVYYPGYGTTSGDAGVADAGDQPSAWSGISESGTVTKAQEIRYETPKLAAGNYLFSMTGTGDADLYVRVGTAPTAKLYDCRPYKTGSKESCKVNLTTTAPIHVMVRGYANSSTFKLVGNVQP
ncbi:MAG: PPC domain-containing protein [Deltaproteobacteria bacterium]|nr:PPC domain-containing protein [Deltaproteobacteria bacterium]